MIPTRYAVALAATAFFHVATHTAAPVPPRPSYVIVSDDAAPPIAAPVPITPRATPLIAAPRHHKPRGAAYAAPRRICR